MRDHYKRLGVALHSRIHHTVRCVCAFNYLFFAFYFVFLFCFFKSRYFCFRNHLFSLPISAALCVLVVAVIVGKFPVVNIVFLMLTLCLNSKLHFHAA